MKETYLKAALFVFVCTIVLFRLVNISALDDGRARNQIFGDGYSDINTLSSAWYFHDSGFAQTAYLPMHDYKIPGRAPVVYTHYPALPNILAGLYATVFNSNNESVLRIVPFLLSLFFFFFIFKTYRLLIPDPHIAFFAGAIIVLSNYFIAWADNLHQHLYGELLKWLYLYIIYTYYENGRKETWKLVLMMLIMLLEVNISFEHPVFVGMLTACFAVLYNRNPVTKETVLVFLALVAGFGLHILQNVVYFGSFDAALTDMKDAFILRTSGEATAAGVVSEAHLGVSALWEIPFMWFNRMERYFVFPGWFVLIILIPAMKRIRRESRTLYGITWSLFICSIAWSFVMPQHSYVHTFTCKHFGIWYGIVAAYGTVELIRLVRVWWQQKRYLYAGVGMLAGLYAAVMFITQHVFELYIKFGVAYPALGR